ncbi:MAG TPA: redoxin family protein [Pirellulaceae bacterium]|nr:redoxin family protein [Pirellulaceae bacterium]
MSRLLLSLALLLALGSLISAAEEKIPLGPPGATLDDVHQNPDDPAILTKFASPHFREISMLSDEDPDAAEKKLAEFEAVLDSLKVGEKAQPLLTRLKASITAYRENIASDRLTLADVEKELTENPDDIKAFRNWSNKALSEMYGIAYSRPEQAEAKLSKAKEFLAKVSEAAQNDNTKERIASLSDPRRGSFSQIEQAIAKGREYAELIGKAAAPLTVETWVNGTPLTAGDLNGKVVLLDFWAVWCGPCIATFPHLREWQEKYGDKGLVIIGVTSYYNYKWDDEAGYTARADGEVTPEEEQETLQKFAAYYHLKHRFAVQPEGDRTLSEHYGVSGIPHVVVLDKTGKIRLIRVGSGKQNAEDIDKLLAELLKA